MFAEADLTSPVTIKQLCDCFDIRPNKRYGQNFLIDYNIVQKITDSAGLTSSDRVLEIGPGIGTLTREISKKAGPVMIRGVIFIQRHRADHFDRPVRALPL